MDVSELPTPTSKRRDMKDPEITVVMATYRHKKFLIEAIESIRKQSVDARIEVVWVWKDMKNSKDVLLDYRIGNTLQWDMMSQADRQYRTESYMEWLGDTYVQKPDMWEQRQHGLERAWEHICHPEGSVQYVCFFDSDDVMQPGWLEKGLAVAEEITSRGKIPIVGPSYRMVDEKLNPLQEVILPEFSMDKMLEGCIIPDFSITTAEALRSVGGFFDPDYPINKTYNFYATWLRMLKKYGDKLEVKLLPDIGFLYRQHKKNLHHKVQSKRNSQRNVDMQKEIARHYFPEAGR